MRAPLARRSAGGLLVCGTLLLASCRTTIDTLGHDRGEVGGGGEGGGAGSGTLGPLKGPDTYPNYFKEVLGKTDTEISAKIAAAFDRLFHGDAANDAVYVTVGTDQAHVRDVLHGDIRSEGIGWGMIIAVELSKQVEFDKLWAYAKAELAYPEGDANFGYFRSFCDTGTGSTEVCADPFGFQQMLTALLFARTRFVSAPGHDYEADARALFEVLEQRAQGNTGLFDPSAHLVLHLPNAAAAGVTRPSISMPAYYELYAQATGDAVYSRAATATRAFFHLAGDVTTGLMPVRSQFDGTPVQGFADFGPEGYRAPINLALDRIFFNKDPWQIDQAKRQLDFFAKQGIDNYGQIYTLDGTCLDPCLQDAALVAVNGVTAAIAPASPDRTAFIQAVWDLTPPSGVVRYYPGMLHLISLLILGGQYRVY